MPFPFLRSWHYRRLRENSDTTGFSRVVLQLSPNKNQLAAADTTDFSRVEFQLLPEFHAPNRGRS
jgi:hypothetical protein